MNWTILIVLLLSLINVSLTFRPTPGPCQPLPTLGTATIVNSPSSIQSAVDLAQPGDVIALASGVWNLTSRILIETERLTVRSVTGDPKDVILDFGWLEANGFKVSASNVTIAGITVKRTGYHGVQVQPAQTIVGTVIYNMHFIDSGNQFIKVDISTGIYSDFGIIACNRLEATEESHNLPFCEDTGGISLFGTDSWHIYNNHISGLYCPNGIHPASGIKAYHSAKDTLIENNLIVDCYQGIGIGGSNPDQRSYSPSPCSVQANTLGVGHFRGIIRNNLIYGTGPGIWAVSYFDTGIGIESSCEAKIYHNTIYSSQTPHFADIYWRYESSLDIVIRNNLLRSTHFARDNAPAADDRGTISKAPVLNWLNPFTLPPNFNLSETATAVGAGFPLSPGECDYDFDWQRRILESPDVGADQIRINNEQPSDEIKTSSSSEGGSSSIIGIAVGVSIGGLLILAILAVLIFFFIRRRNAQANSSVSSTSRNNLTPVTPYRDFEMKNTNSNNGSTEYSSVPSPRSDSVMRSNVSIPNANKNFVVNYKELEGMTEIGRGAFGVVYRAKWRATEVAVKQIINVANEKDMQDFISELEILQSLRPHPNVILLLGIVKPPSPLCLITDFCKNGSLQGYLKSSAKIDLNKQIFILSGVARGMLHLHSENIIHRDLAARNILLGTNFEAKVADFGYARSGGGDDYNKTSSNVGPIRWMSPESIKKRVYSVKSDIWSYGVVIWEVLTRSEPYANKTPVEVAMEVVYENLRLQIPSNCPSIFSKLMKDCFKDDPNERPTFKEICAEFTNYEKNRNSTMSFMK